jgi:hypothetical protein
MKLNLVVASMSVLGLVMVSGPVSAATHHVKHKRHHVEHDYKDMAVMKDKDQPVCTISQNTVIMDGMTQNYGRSMPNPCNPGWFNRIQVAGGVNVDIGHWGNRNMNYMGENYQRVSLNDAYLNIAADVSDWAKAFASLSYMTATTNVNPGVFNARGLAEYSAAYANNIKGTGNNTVQLEQGFATIGNLDASPFFVQVGKSFQDFSRYEIHPITRSLDQVLSEVLATSLKVGFIASGFHGSIYGFDDPVAKVGTNSSTTNYGATLGFDAPSDSLGWDLGVGYLYNLVGSNDVAYAIQNFNGGTGYKNRVGAGNVYADVNSGPFSIGARYTAALQNFSTLDLPQNGFGNVVAPAAVFGGVGSGLPTATVAGTTGAKPWALAVKAGYGFDAWGKTQGIFLGYQASSQAAGLNIPKYRWLVGYSADMFKNNNWAVEWDHDGSYSATNGGSGNNGNLVTIRSTVKFG